MTKRQIYEGDWPNVLYYQYYHSTSASAFDFTEREQKYIQDVVAGKKTITVTASCDRRPYSYLEDGQLKGILPDYFAQVMELAGLPYEIILPEDYEEYQRIMDTNGVDVVIDRRVAPINQDTYDGFLTDTYISTGMAKMTRKDFSGEAAVVAVADVQGDLPVEQGLTGDARLLRFPTREEALQAVLDGNADAALF